MSPAQLLKRALVFVLLEIARAYCSDLSLNRDTSDADVWAPKLMRGKLHVEVFNEGFPGESPEGAKQFVARVRSAVSCRF